MIKPHKHTCLLIANLPNNYNALATNLQSYYFYLLRFWIKLNWHDKASQIDLPYKYYNNFQQHEQ
jgi:hypothetical protein